MEKKVTVIICGDTENEHTTYVEHEGQHFKFYTDGYDGVSECDIREFLEFLGYEVFEVHNDKFQTSDTCVN